MTNTQEIEYIDGGWWFWDETWTSRYGPFTSKEIAEKFLDVYAYELEVGPQNSPNSFKNLTLKYENKTNAKLIWKNVEDAS